MLKNLKMLNMFGVGRVPADLIALDLQSMYTLTLGISLPHNAAEQYNYGKPVNKSSLQPGDLVFFGKTDESIYHVGIYIGKGNFINAPKEGESVKITALSYMPDYYGAKRLRHVK
jgi:cell wall-associated NlpC family hydrolase